MIEYDLLIRASRVFCSVNDYDGPGCVAITGNRIAAFESELAGSAKRVLEITDGVLLPGLVDFHAHPAHGDSKYGIDPDDHLLPGNTSRTKEFDRRPWPSYNRKLLLGVRLCRFTANRNSNMTP